jgi:RimJ/RimL family protein N-acetyltransferase
VIVTEQSEQIKEWIESRIRDTTINDFKNCSTLAVAREGRLIAGVAYWVWDTGNCDVAIAADSPRWATKQTIYTLFAYPFEQIGCRRLTSLIHPKNKRSRKLCEGLGFQVEGKLRKMMNGRDMLIYGYLKDEFMRSKWCGKE